MSVQTFVEFTAKIRDKPVELAALRASLSNPRYLVQFASAMGHPITLEEAEMLIEEAKMPDSAVSLTDQALDHVSAAGWRRNFFS